MLEFADKWGANDELQYFEGTYQLLFGLQGERLKKYQVMTRASVSHSTIIFVKDQLLNFDVAVHNCVP